MWQEMKVIFFTLPAVPPLLRLSSLTDVISLNLWLHINSGKAWKALEKAGIRAEDTEDGGVDNMALKGRVCRLVVSVGGGPVLCEVWHLLKPHPDELLMWPEASARDQARGSIWQVLDQQWLTGHNVEVKETGESEEKLRSSTIKACKCWRHQKTVC